MYEPNYMMTPFSDLDESLVHEGKKGMEWYSNKMAQDHDYRVSLGLEEKQEREPAKDEGSLADSIKRARKQEQAAAREERKLYKARMKDQSRMDRLQARSDRRAMVAQAKEAKKANALQTKLDQQQAVANEKASIRKTNALTTAHQLDNFRKGAIARLKLNAFRTDEEKKMVQDSLNEKLKREQIKAQIRAQKKDTFLGKVGNVIKDAAVESIKGQLTTYANAGRGMLENQLSKQLGLSRKQLNKELSDQSYDAWVAEQSFNAAQNETKKEKLETAKQVETQKVKDLKAAKDRSDKASKAEKEAKSKVDKLKADKEAGKTVKDSDMQSATAAYESARMENAAANDAFVRMFNDSATTDSIKLNALGTTQSDAVKSSDRQREADLREAKKERDKAATDAAVAKAKVDKIKADKDAGKDVPTQFENDANKEQSEADEKLRNANQRFDTLYNHTAMTDDVRARVLGTTVDNGPTVDRAKVSKAESSYDSDRTTAHTQDISSRATKLSELVTARDEAHTKYEAAVAAQRKMQYDKDHGRTVTERLENELKQRVKDAEAEKQKADDAVSSSADSKNEDVLKQAFNSSHLPEAKIDKAKVQDSEKNYDTAHNLMEQRRNLQYKRDATSRAEAAYDAMLQDVRAGKDVPTETQDRLKAERDRARNDEAKGYSDLGQAMLRDSETSQLVYGTDKVGDLQFANNDAVIQAGRNSYQSMMQAMAAVTLPETLRAPAMQLRDVGNDEVNRMIRDRFGNDTEESRDQRAQETIAQQKANRILNEAQDIEAAEEAVRAVTLPETLRAPAMRLRDVSNEEVNRMMHDRFGNDTEESRDQRAQETIAQQKAGQILDRARDIEANEEAVRTVTLPEALRAPAISLRDVSDSEVNTMLRNRFGEETAEARDQRAQETIAQQKASQILDRARSIESNEEAARAVTLPETLRAPATQIREVSDEEVNRMLRDRFGNDTEESRDQRAQETIAQQQADRVMARANRMENDAIVDQFDSRAPSENPVTNNRATMTTPINDRPYADVADTVKPNTYETTTPQASPATAPRAQSVSTIPDANDNDIRVTVNDLGASNTYLGNLAGDYVNSGSNFVTTNTGGLRVQGAPKAETATPELKVNSGESFTQEDQNRMMRNAEQLQRAVGAPTPTPIQQAPATHQGPQAPAQEPATTQESQPPKRRGLFGRSTSPQSQEQQAPKPQTLSEAAQQAQRNADAIAQNGQSIDAFTQSLLGASGSTNVTPQQPERRRGLFSRSAQQQTPAEQAPRPQTLSEAAQQAQRNADAIAQNGQSLDAFTQSLLGVSGSGGGSESNTKIGSIGGAGKKALSFLSGIGKQAISSITGNSGQRNTAPEQPKPPTAEERRQAEVAASRKARGQRLYNEDPYSASEIKTSGQKNKKLQNSMIEKYGDIAKHIPIRVLNKGYEAVDDWISEHNTRGKG